MTIRNWSKAKSNWSTIARKWSGLCRIQRSILIVTEYTPHIVASWPISPPTSYIQPNAASTTTFTYPTYKSVAQPCLTKSRAVQPSAAQPSSRPRRPCWFWWLCRLL